MARSPLPADLEYRTTARVPKSSVHWVECQVCNQRFNLNNLTEAYHHNAEPHEQMKQRA